MRNSTLIFSSLLLSLCLSCTRDMTPVHEKPAAHKESHIISIEKARADLQALLNEMEKAETKATEYPQHREISSSYSVGSPIGTKVDDDIEPYVHIFNFDDEAGFAIMSGDDRTSPLLALAFKGNLKQNGEIDSTGFGCMLEHLRQAYIADVQRVLVDSGMTVEFYPVVGPWQWSESVIDCKVKWGQGIPYNRYCELSGSSVPPPTGCVTVAVAQLMSIHEYPTYYNGYTFDWTCMTSSSQIADDNSAQTTYVARLMQQLGRSCNLNVDYDTDGSGARISNIPRTFTNMGYQSGGSVVDFSDTSVNYDLFIGYPIIISGYSHENRILGIATHSGGHAWLAHGRGYLYRVIDLYDEDGVFVSSYTENRNLILCNFGWNGSCDGYYYHGSFNTNNGPAYNWTRAGTDHYYQYKLKAVTGIRKN